jgi:hypothetical protein
VAKASLEKQLKQLQMAFNDLAANQMVASIKHQVAGLH